MNDEFIIVERPPTVEEYQPDHQGLSVGRRLVEKLIELVQRDVPVKIQTYARNTSVGFFTELGFTPIGYYLEHEEFAKHGIKFQQMRLEVPQNGFQ